MVVLGVAVGDFLLPLLPAGLAVGVGWSGVRRGYIPNALKMVTELYHSTAKPTKTVGSISHAQLGRGRLICGSEKHRSFFFPACWMLSWISAPAVVMAFPVAATSRVSAVICAWMESV